MRRGCMSDFAEEVGGTSNGAGGARAVANGVAIVGCGTCPAELRGPSETARLGGGDVDTALLGDLNGSNDARVVGGYSERAFDNVWMGRARD